MRTLSTFLSLSLLASCALETDDDTLDTTDQTIVGGSTTTQWDAIGYVHGDHGRCSGTLIAPNIFLTAAHCTYDGTLFVGFGAYRTGPQTQVTTILRAPQYVRNQTETVHDVAVLVLATSTSITPLDFAGTEYPNVTPPGRELRIVGYGDTTSGISDPDPTPAPVQRKTAHVHVDAARTFELSTTGINGAGCFGDSGGPIMDLNGTKVYGVSSRVYTPCTSTTRNTYAAVGHETFIAAAIRNHPPQPRASSAALWRYWQPTVQDHYYTVDRNDAGLAAFGYAPEGNEGRVFRGALPGTTPIYRYYNATTYDHFYTGTRDDVGAAAFGYAFERIEGYVFPRAYASTVPLHRYWSSARTDHFYTVHRDDAGMTALGYVYEGNIGHVYP